MEADAESRGQATGVWYCPVCGYVDPKTGDTNCPQRHPGGAHPLFKEAVYGYYVRVGIEELKARV